ncbi:ribonuclease H-like domain-containing protein [Tanacetum coccineum]
MTNSSKAMFDLVDISKLKLTVGYRNITLSKITHVGNLKLNNDVVLFDVFVVPEYCVCLLYVNRLIKDSKLSVGFDETKCYIQDLKKKRTLEIGSEFGGLYVFDKEYNKSVVSHNRSDKFYEKDVKFYENVFRYKMSNNTKSSESSKNDVSSLNFFDNMESETAAKAPSSSPNDDEEGPYARDGDVHQLVTDYMDKSGHDDQHIATPVGEENLFEGNVSSYLEVPTFENNSPNQTEEVGPGVKRSSRPSKLLAKLNEYVLDGKVKYGLHRYANHSLRSGDNYCFVSNLNKSFEPFSFEEASIDINWINAMNDEMLALYENDTWVLTDLPAGRKPIGSKWAFRIKYKSDGEIERYKARLVAKGFSQKVCIDYEETFSHVGELNEESKNDHSLFVKNTGTASSFLIRKFKQFLSNKKYCLELLYDFGLLSCSPVMTTLPENIILAHKEFDDDKPDISYVMHCLSQHMHSPLKSHLNIALRVLKYLKLASGNDIEFSKRESNFDIIAFSDSDWAKCPVTRRSSTEAEYRSMASVTCEVMWIVKVVKDLYVENLIPASCIVTLSLQYKLQLIL